MDEYEAIVQSLSDIDQRIRQDNTGVFTEILILFDHVLVARTQLYSGYDGYQVGGRDLRYALVNPLSRARNTRRPYYVSNQEANVSLADSEVVSMEQAWRWMTAWKAGHGAYRQQLVQQQAAWREAMEAGASDLRAREYERLRMEEEPLPPPPQIWGPVQEKAWQTEVDRGEAAANEVLRDWDSRPRWVTVILVGNIGPCDGCKARLKVFLHDLSAEMFPKALVMVKAVYTGQEHKPGVRGDTDRLETEYGYPDRAQQMEYRSAAGTSWRPWVRIVTPWPVQ